VSLIEVRNPATGKVAGTVPEATSAGIREAVSKAREAQRTWREVHFSKRAEIVRRFHDQILDRRDTILDTVQSETGKARRDALAELFTVAGTARYYLAHGESHISPRKHRPAIRGVTTAEVMYKPHGIVGLITPWNYPFLLGIADALPALLAGNAVIIKPSELTPLSAVVARDCLVESGLDPNLAVIIHGSGMVGAELIGHVDYIGFTGGTATGRKVAVAAAERLIPCSLELGGKNPMVILEGAPLDEAASGLIAGAFSNSGQTCISVERVYVEQSIYDDFAARVVDRTGRLKLGWSSEWDIDMGCLISEAHARKVLSHVNAARSAGARVLAGGRARPDLGPAFVEPTVLANVTEDMAIATEETFGPVVSLFPVPNREEAVRRANASRYGLNSSVWAGTQREAIEIARRLETGSTVINSTLLIYNTFDVPMGGVKQSGIGRRHGEQGILRYTQSQSIVGSVPSSGGYDVVALGVNNQQRADLLVRAMRLWRKIPWIG
jgi:succinate-semialdehyde dehydrogenase/glutarate-semialdehyde dehydrogenase